MCLRLYNKSTLQLNLPSIGVDLMVFDLFVKPKSYGSKACGIGTNKIYQNNTIIYKVLLFLITTVAIVYLFPKGGQFKYEFNNGKVWKYDNLYATFDFAIQKTEAEIALEKNKKFMNSRLPASPKPT